MAKQMKTALTRRERQASLLGGIALNFSITMGGRWTVMASPFLASPR
jgi:hypothetical protein